MQNGGALGPAELLGDLMGPAGRLPGRLIECRAMAAMVRRYGAVVRTCLGVERCSSITLWGFTDAASWIPQERPGHGAATAYDGNYRPKPAWHAIWQALGLDTPGSHRTRARTRRQPGTTGPGAMAGSRQS